MISCVSSDEKQKKKDKTKKILIEGRKEKKFVSPLTQIDEDLPERRTNDQNRYSDKSTGEKNVDAFSSPSSTRINTRWKNHFDSFDT